MSDDGWRGKVGALARDEVDEFLAEGRIARLGCLDGEGWPYVVPVWHEWDGSAFWVVARRRSLWASYLRDDGRCSLAIDEDGRQRKVLAQCRAEVVEEPCLDGQWVPGGRADEPPLPGRERAEVPRPDAGQAALADPAGPGEGADLAGQRLGGPLQVSAVVELTERADRRARARTRPATSAPRPP